MIDNLFQSKYPFTPFYRENHLLVQFILTTFAQTYPLVREFEKIDFELLELDQLFQGFQQNFWTEDPLTKLKEYALLFCQNMEMNQKTSRHFFLAVHRACTAIQQCREIWAALYLPSVGREIPKWLATPIQRYAKSFKRSFCTITRTLPSLVLPYRDNENVILTLLKNKEFFQTVYGENFLLRFLHYPLSQEELVEWLIERYEERGFDFLTPFLRIHQKEQTTSHP